MNVGEWLGQAKGRLGDAGIKSPGLEAQLLAAHVLMTDRAFVLTHPELEFPEFAGEHVLQRREGQEPLAYILGWREFFGRPFRVGPGVLVPRHETETLVEVALEYLRTKTEPASVLDLGTGSGCLAITIKLEHPSAEVIATDITGGALEIAASNAEKLGARVIFDRSDGFKELAIESFDLIVTNPPYVGLSEPLPAEILNYEPHEALYSGHTGLEFYERLSSEAAAYLRDGGKLVMEVGYRQAREVQAIFEASGWNVVEVRPDLSGIERVVVVEPVFV
jgi:release factor glutamine methyltransferase